MFSYRITIFFTALMIILANSCSDSPAPDQPEENKVNSGQADFTSVVAIGNSLTAGVRANYLAGVNQANSFPALIARQMGLSAGRGSENDFVIPYIFPGVGSQQSFLEYNDYGLPVLFGVPLFGGLTNGSYNKPYNNLGIPLARSGDITTVTLSTNAPGGNLLFDLILRNQGSSNAVISPAQTVVEQAASLDPTFVFLWIGNNDALGAATSGNTEPGLPTPVNTFTANLEAAFATLTANNSSLKGAIANIPDVASIPFVTTVPPEISLPGGGKQFLYIVLGDGSSRQATPQDRILLDAVTVIGDTSGSSGPAGVAAGLDPSAPLADDLVLDAAEVQSINDAIAGYNSAIANLAQQYGFALVDANTLLMDIAANGITIEGVTYTTDLVNGGLFSLDGVHPDAAGYGIIANAFIDAINLAYGSEIPRLTVSEVE